MDYSFSTDSGIEISKLNFPLSTSFLHMLDDEGEEGKEGKSPRDSSNILT